MRKVTSKEVHSLINRSIQVCYVKHKGAQGLNIVTDYLITPPVLLRSYDAKTQTLSVERSDGQMQSFQYPVEVFAVD
jgi:hypothetical protein